MTNPREKRSTGVKQDIMNHEWTYQEVVPSSGWTEDSKFHYIHVDLPDFSEDDIRLQVGKSGQLTVIGGRLCSQDHEMYISFEKTFKLPENSDTGAITGRFEGDILYISIPKLVNSSMKDTGISDDATSSAVYDEEEEEEDCYSSTKVSDDDSEENYSRKSQNPGKGTIINGYRNRNCYVEEWKKKCREEGNLFKVALKQVNELKEIFVTAAFAFTLGMLVSQKLHQTLPK